MTLTFNKNFYNLESVKMAVRAYNEFVDFDVRNQGAEIEVELSEIDKDVKEVIGDEFSNYVLAAMQELKVDKKNGQKEL